MLILTKHSSVMGIPVVCQLGVSVVPELVSIEQESNRPPWNEVLFRGEFSNLYSMCYGVRFGGELAGFLICHVVLDEAHIVNFAVRKTLRGLGLGRRLLSNVLSGLHRQGVRWVTLEVRASNDRAQELYKSVGFSDVGTRPRYYSDDQEDALTMALSMAQFAHHYREEEPSVTLPCNSLLKKQEIVAKEVSLPPEAEPLERQQETRRKAATRFGCGRAASGY